MVSGSLNSRKGLGLSNERYRSTTGSLEQHGSGKRNLPFFSLFPIPLAGTDIGYIFISIISDKSC